MCNKCVIMCNKYFHYEVNESISEKFKLPFKQWLFWVWIKWNWIQNDKAKTKNNWRNQTAHIRLVESKLLLPQALESTWFALWFKDSEGLYFNSLVRYYHLDWISFHSQLSANGFFCFRVERSLELIIYVSHYGIHLSREITEK